MTTVRDLITHLHRNYQPDDTIAAPIWQVDDVVLAAEQRDIGVTPDVAADILERIDANHDAGLGITWDTIDAHLVEMLARTAVPKGGA